MKIRRIFNRLFFVIHTLYYLFLFNGCGGNIDEAGQDGGGVPSTGGGCELKIHSNEIDPIWNIPLVIFGNPLDFTVYNQEDFDVSGSYEIWNPDGIQVDVVTIIEIDNNNSKRFSWDTNREDVFAGENWSLRVNLGSNLCQANFTIEGDQAPWDTDGDRISDALELENANLTTESKTDKDNPDIPDENPDTGTNDWTRALGTPQTGTLEKGMRIADMSTGYRYWSNTDTPDTDNWGTLTILNMVESVGRSWFEDYVNYEIVTNDISLEFGGDWQPDHLSHQNGRDIDMYYVRDTDPSPDDLVCITESGFDLNRTSELLLMIAVRSDVTNIFVAHDSEDEEANYGTTLANLHTKISQVTGHPCHFHVRIIDPDGEGN